MRMTAVKANVAYWSWRWAVPCLVLLAACSSDEPAALSQPVESRYVGSVRCADCHGAEYDGWAGSHHDLAMQVATESSVLGDFNGVTFTYADVESRFYKRGDRYLVTTDGPDGELVEYEISYTFGAEPLQQYLIEFPDGRLQALSISWDSRPAAEGGQRWFHLYPREQVDHEDPLHWTGPLQNWNFMCAECHSTQVEKNYSAEAQRFATTWSGIDVGCEACHGPGAEHVAWANSGDGSDAAGTDDPKIVAFSETAAWVMDAASGIAARQPPRESSTQLETCARCHSRRSSLSADYVHGRVLADTHRPALLTEGLYFSDGQVQDEVYVYGSFLQSAMHGAGVTCSDCHDAHALTIKAEGNALCAGCHSPSVFDTPAHHHHAPDESGAECVGCHMPSRDYMVIDGRRDHSFRIPRPDLSATLGVPNACNDCHNDRDPAWAAAEVAEWFPGSRQTHYGEAIDAGRHGRVGASAALSELAADVEAPGIVRATAVSLLAANVGPSTPSSLENATTASDPLLRLAAAEAAQVLDEDSQVRLVAPLLRDPVKAVRLAAAARLGQVPRRALRQAQADDLAAALGEYRATQDMHADRPEAHVNLALLHTAQGDMPASVDAYRRAIALQPAFVPAYLNLADLYRTLDREADVDAVLRRGLAAAPDSGELHHALGLSLVRQRDYERGVAELRRAHELSPSQTRFAYVLGVALNSIGETAQSLAVLEAAHEQRPNHRDVLLALTTISMESGRGADARVYVDKLLVLSPTDSTARRLADQLKAN